MSVEQSRNKSPGWIVTPVPHRLAGPLLVCLGLLLLAACSTPDLRAPLGRTPVAAKKASFRHVVHRGETLYAIAWQYHLDYRDLASWNAITSPYTIYPGQKLRVSKKAASQRPRARSRPGKTTVRAPSASTRQSTRTTARKPGKSTTSPIKRWKWPARGKLVARFKLPDKQGINISGKSGQAVMATAGGRVVYAGSGLRGYGKLIIVKHNKRFLSAYAHNKKLLVSEGQTVASGERIAEMGRSGARRVMLHFEVRRDGKPVDPMRYLPG